MLSVTLLLKTPVLLWALELSELRSVTRETQDVFTRKIHYCVFHNKTHRERNPEPKLRVSHTREWLEENRHNTTACYSLYFTLRAFVLTVAAELVVTCRSHTLNLDPRHTLATRIPRARASRARLLITHVVTSGKPLYFALRYPYAQQLLRLSIWQRLLLPCGKKHKFNREYLNPACSQ